MYVFFPIYYTSLVQEIKKYENKHVLVSKFCITPSRLCRDLQQHLAPSSI